MMTLAIVVITIKSEIEDTKMTYDYQKQAISDAKQFIMEKLPAMDKAEREDIIKDAVQPASTTKDGKYKIYTQILGDHMSIKYDLDENIATEPEAQVNLAGRSDAVDQKILDEIGYIPVSSAAKHDRFAKYAYAGDGVAAALKDRGVAALLNQMADEVYGKNKGFNLSGLDGDDLVR